MAHCASEGCDEDCDIKFSTNPNSKKKVPKEDAVDLFLRLMKEPKYDGQLFGDISAITAFKRVGALVKVIQETDIHQFSASPLSLLFFWGKTSEKQ